MKTEGKFIKIVRLILAMVMLYTIFIIGPQMLHSLKESLEQQAQQVCFINLLQVEMLNTSSSIKEAAINSIINNPECQSLFTNNTTTNG
jgi:CII-binding regulator of phage lambda lysogenization HflD